MPFRTFQLISGRALGMNMPSNIWENGPWPGEEELNFDFPTTVIIEQLTQFHFCFYRYDMAMCWLTEVVAKSSYLHTEDVSTGDKEFRLPLIQCPDKLSCQVAHSVPHNIRTQERVTNKPIFFLSIISKKVSLACQWIPYEWENPFFTSFAHSLRAKTCIFKQGTDVSRKLPVLTVSK